MKQRIKRISVLFVILAVFIASYCAALRVYYMYDIFFEYMLWNTEERGEIYYSSDNKYRMTVYYEKNSTSTELYHKIDKKRLQYWIPDAVYVSSNGMLTEKDDIISVLDSYNNIENHHLHNDIQKIDNNELFASVMAYMIDRVTLKRSAFPLFAILLIIAGMEFVSAINTKRKQGYAVKKQLKDILVSKTGITIIILTVILCILFRMFLIHSSFIAVCDLDYFAMRRIYPEYCYSDIDNDVRFHVFASGVGNLIFMEKRYGTYWVDYKIYLAKSGDLSKLFYVDDYLNPATVLGDEKYNQKYIKLGRIEEFGFVDMIKYCFEYLYLYRSTYGEYD